MKSVCQCIINHQTMSSTMNNNDKKNFIKENLSGFGYVAPSGTTDQFILLTPMKGYQLLPGWKLMLNAGSTKIYPKWCAPGCSFEPRRCNCDARKTYTSAKKWKTDLLEGRIKICGYVHPIHRREKCNAEYLNSNMEFKRIFDLDDVHIARKKISKKDNGERKRKAIEVKLTKLGGEIKKTKIRVECGVCMEEFIQDEHETYLTCGSNHVFCRGCVENAVKLSNQKCEKNGLQCLSPSCNRVIEWKKGYIANCEEMGKKHQKLFLMSGAKQQRQTNSQNMRKVAKYTQHLLWGHSNFMEQHRINDICKDICAMGGLMCCNRKHAFTDWDACSAIKCDQCKPTITRKKITFKWKYNSGTMTHATATRKVGLDRFYMKVVEGKEGTFATVLDNGPTREILEKYRRWVTRALEGGPHVFDLVEEEDLLVEEPYSSFCLYCNKKFETKKEIREHASHLEKCKYLNILNIPTNRSVFVGEILKPVMIPRVRWLRFACKIRHLIRRDAFSILEKLYDREEPIMNDVMDTEWKRLDSFTQDDKNLYKCIAECSDYLKKRKSGMTAAEVLEEWELHLFNL